MAFQLGWFWALIYIGIIAAFAFSSLQAPPIPDGPPDPSFQHLFSAIIILVFAIPTLGIIAIGWHRYILREERPNSFYVLRREWPLGGYIWNTVKIIFAILIMMFLIFFIVLYVILPLVYPTIFTEFSPNSIQFTLRIIFGVFAAWLFLRLGTVLPALAVNEKMTLRGSFQLTSPISGQLLIAAFWITLLQLTPSLVQIVLVATIGPASIAVTGVSIAVSIIFGFINVFVGLGILAVIYGHLAEGKRI